MEETYRTKAIILGRKPFRECDAIATVYTFEKGKLDLVVKGAKKIKSKLAGHIEPMNLSEIMVVRGRGYDYIGSAVNKNCYINIKSNLNLVSCAGKAVNIFNKLVKHEEKDEDLFFILENFLEILNNENIGNNELFYNFFILKLLDLLGNRPELYNCVVCCSKISENNNKFDFLKGGVVCGKCLKNKNSAISDDCIKILRFAIKNDFCELKKLKINDILASEANFIISSFLAFYS